jgi:hypothetical protein
MTLMNPQHARWQEFVTRLEGPEGCNFRKDKSGQITWKCEGGRDKRLAIAILRQMADIDLDASVNYFESNSGYCDCEILFNVGR